jgi:hypothetical protein
VFRVDLRIGDVSFERLLLTFLHLRLVFLYFLAIFVELLLPDEEYVLCIIEVTRVATQHIASISALVFIESCPQYSVKD